MADAAKKQATYADLEALPSNIVGEIIFRSLVTHPRPARRHGGSASALGVALGAAYQFGDGGPGGWIFLDEPELHLGPHVLVPDLAAWKREHITEPADRAWFEVAPDWACEVLSPSTEKYDKGDKRAIYALHEVGHLWHVDPRSKSLEVFARRGKDWLLSHTLFESDRVCAPPFEDTTFSPDRLWPFDSPVPPTK
jgi:Uma2 family endonuclease